MDACPGGTLTHGLSSETIQALELPPSAFRKTPQMHEAPPPMSQIYQEKGPRAASPTGIRREQPRANADGKESGPNEVNAEAAPKTMARFASQPRAQMASQVGSRARAQTASQPRASADGDESDPNDGVGTVCQSQ